MVREEAKEDQYLYTYTYRVLGYIMMVRMESVPDCGCIWVV